MSDTVRIGIVGAGAVVQVAHLPALRRMKGVAVTAICDSDVPKARAIAQRHGNLDVYDDIQDLLGSGAVDAVSEILRTLPARRRSSSASTPGSDSRSKSGR